MALYSPSNECEYQYQVVQVKVNFGFLDCFDAENPIIAASRWTFKVYTRFSRNVIFILLAKISQQGESVCCIGARSFPSARAIKWTKSLEFGPVVQE